MANFIELFDTAPIAAGVPAGFVDRWVAGGTYSIVADNIAGRSLRSAPVGGGRYFVSMSAVDADANRANAEILALVRADVRSAGVTHEGVVARGSGAAATETGYVAGFLGREFRIGKYVAGTFTELAITTGFNAADSTRYYIRLRVNGTTVQGKVWDSAGGEPGPWTHTATDASISAAGWCGFFTFGAPVMECAQIAVGTNGDTATFSAGGAGVAVGSPRQYTEAQVQAQARALTGSAGMFTEDLHAYFTFRSIAAGQFNERLIAWAQLVSASTAIQTASAAYDYLLANGATA